MKQKILAKLIVKYPGLSKVFLGHLAEDLSEGVTDEAEIEGILTALDTAPIKVEKLAAQFQKEGDRRVTTAQKEWEKANPKPANGKTEEPDADQDEQELPADTPAWAKTLLKSNKELADKVSKLESEKTQTSIMQQIKGHEKMKDVPEEFWNEWRLPEKPEQVDAFVDKASTKYGTFAQALPQQPAGLGSMPAPKVGTPTQTGQVKEATKEEIASIEL